MDQLYEMSAAGVPVEIGGQTYRIMPLRLKDWGEAARVMLGKKRRPADVLRECLKDLPDDAQRRLVELAYHDERQGELIPGYELERWFRQPDGAVFEFWLMVRQVHAEITLERAEQLYEQSQREAAARQALRRQQELNQGQLVGNSSSQARANARAARRASRSPGGASSAA